MAFIASKILTKTTYKALLKTATRLDRLVPTVEVATELRQFKACSDATSFCAAVRSAYRATPPDNVDSAFVALRQGNTLLAALTSPVPAVIPRAPEPATKFTVGQVFRHRKFGYRAVIIEADECCRASAGWVAATGTARLARGASQPFYTCLVDIRDRPGAQVSYVAEENVDLVLAPSEDQAAGRSSAAVALPLVLHPLIAKHFVAYAHGVFLQEGVGASDGGEGGGSVPVTGAKSMAA